MSITIKYLNTTLTLSEHEFFIPVISDINYRRPDYRKQQFSLPENKTHYEKKHMCAFAHQGPLDTESIPENARGKSENSNVQHSRPIGIDDNRNASE